MYMVILFLVDHASPPLADNSTQKLLSKSACFTICHSVVQMSFYRPHIQAIKDHVICKVAHIAVNLALEFGISKEEASDLAKNGDGQIEIFRIWLKKGPQTWEELLKLLCKLNEHKLANELRENLEKKGIHAFCHKTRYYS